MLNTQVQGCSNCKSVIIRKVFGPEGSFFRCQHCFNEMREDQLVAVDFDYEGALRSFDPNRRRNFPKGVVEKKLPEDRYEFERIKGQ